LRIRITSMDEKQLAVCLANSLWGSNRNIFKEWESGDILVFCINMEIVAAAKVSGAPDVSELPIWDNGVFPWRIPLTFTHYFYPNNRIPLSGEIRDMFFRKYGEKYGYVFLNKVIIESETANLIMGKITSNQNDIKSLSGK